MSDHPLLSISRAAQLLGMTRASLQQRIRDGELASFDGQVAVEELHRAYPDLNLGDSGAFERVREIKEQAFGRRIRERALPSQEILAQRIFHQSEELEELRRHLQQYHALLDSLRERLESQAPTLLRDAVLKQIDDGLGAILASEGDAPLTAMTVMQSALKMVSAQVTVRPSGHEFIVEGNDCLLQSGLKAGLRLNYGCGSGNCGLCKARLISGEVRQMAPADYPLSEAERASGHILTCVCAPVTDLVIETLEAAGPADIPAQELVATVRAIQPLGGGAAAKTLLLHLQTPRSNRLRFLAGQSVTLGARIGQHDFTATWPIASCPCDDRNLHFHVPRSAAESEPLARALFDGHLKAGDAINLRGPLGDFTLDPDSRRPLVLFAADTGFAPVKSLIEHALAVDNTDTFGLAWLAAEGAHYLDNQCRMWRDAFDRFHYLPLAGDAAAAAEADRLVAAARGAFDFLDDADIFVAGPAAFVRAALAQLGTHDRHESPQRILSLILQETP
jgi:CDP-4-dehydro-6-deoxyglucose reductase, E3